VTDHIVNMLSTIATSGKKGSVARPLPLSSVGRTQSPETTAGTRARILEMVAEERITVIGTHLRETPALVRREGAGYALAA